VFAGLVTSTIPMYLTEIAPVSIRGAMGVLCPLGITVGVLVAQVLGLRNVLGNSHIILFIVWGNAHITVLLRAPTKLLKFQPRLHQQDATVSSNSSRDQASLASASASCSACEFLCVQCS
jgi:hypothetical protein